MTTPALVTAGIPFPPHLKETLEGTPLLFKACIGLPDRYRVPLVSGSVCMNG